MCKCMEQGMNEEMLTESVVTEKEVYTKEEMEDVVVSLMEELTPKIFMDLDNIQDVSFNSKEFKKGVSDISYLCGKYVAMVNCGISSEDAMTYLINDKTGDANQEQQKLINESQERIAECQQVAILQADV